MERGEQLYAFLDDIYVLCAPHRVVPLFKQLSESLARCRDQTSPRENSGLERRRDPSGRYPRTREGRLAVTLAQSSRDPRGHQSFHLRKVA